MNEDEITKESIKSMILKHIRENEPEIITVNQNNNLLRELKLSPYFEQLLKEALTELHNDKIITGSSPITNTNELVLEEDSIVVLPHPKLNIEYIITRYIEEKKPNNITTAPPNNLTKELNLPPEFYSLVNETLTKLWSNGKIIGDDVKTNSATGKNLVIGIINPRIK